MQTVCPGIHELRVSSTCYQECGCHLCNYTPGRGKIVPCNVIKGTSQFTGKAYENYDYTHRDCRRALTQTYNNCAETHPGGEVPSAFVFPLIAIAHRLQL